jgi:predicted permease
MSLATTFLSTLHLNLRRMGRAPGFALTAIFTAALGITANLVAFGVLDALLLHKLPVPEPDQLSFVQRPLTSDVTLSFPQYRDLRDRNRTFSEIGAYAMLPVGLMLRGETEQRWAMLATGSYFDLLHIHPYLGRFPTADDDKRGMNASPFVVLSYNTWRHDFGGSASTIGQRITLSKKVFTVIGIAPPGFFGTERFIQPTLWVDFYNAPQLVGVGDMESRTSPWTWVIGRRKPDVSVGQAQDDLNRVAHELAQEYPRSDEKLAIALAEPGYVGNFFGPALHAFLNGVMLLAILVLAAACVNLSGLYAARTADRRRDIAIRMALGSSRKRVTTELLFESLFLGLVGGLLGCVLSYVVLHALTNYRPPFDFPIAVVVSPSLRVYAFALFLSVLVGLLCGILPAREARRTGLQELMKAGRHDSRGRRLPLREVLLLVEIALCCLLVSAAAVSLRGLLNARDIRLGFDPKAVIIASYNLAIAGYTSDHTLQFDRALVERAIQIPGVDSAAIANSTPLNIVANSSESVYPARTTDFRPSNILFSAERFPVSPGYFRTAKTALLYGRDFTWADDAKAPAVAIVNERFAQLLFGHQSALGESFISGDHRVVRIIGIAEQGKYQSLQESPEPVVFYSISQGADLFSKLLVRLKPEARDDTAQLSNSVTSLIHEQDPQVPINSVESWQAALAPVLFPARAATVALGILGSLTLVLAMTGIFGLASYTVARRKREFGIRLAVGSTRAGLLGAALGRIVLVELIGCVVGLLLAFASMRLMSAIVYNARATDPLVLLTVAATMALITCTAKAVPAFRALRVKPVILLREE